MKSLALLLAIASLAAPLPTFAQSAAPRPRSSAALINEQLDKPIQFKLNNSALPQVLASIADETGVPVRVSDDVYDLLPYGAQTPLTATVENLSLRDALTAIAGKLALRVDLRDEFVELSPEPALRRIGRRATLQELRTLDVLSSQKLGDAPSAMPVLELTRAIDGALARYDQQLRNAGQPPAKLVVELRTAEGVDLSSVSVMLPRNPTLATALSAMAEQTKMTWYPWGDSVVVLPKKSVIRNQLERSLSLRYDGVDISQVLIDLARRTGVEFSIEPGAIQRVTPEFRIIKLTADAPVRQALESLQGYTGLGYVVTDEGVYIWNQNSTPSGSRGRVIATVEVAPGTNVLVYDDQLSQAAREVLQARRLEAAKRLEASLTGDAATTQPAVHHN